MKKILLMLSLIASMLHMNAMDHATKLSLLAATDRISAISVIIADLNTTTKLINNVDIQHKFPLWQLDSNIVPILGAAAIGLSFMNNDSSAIISTPSFMTSCFAGLYAVARSMAVDNAINEQKEKKMLQVNAPHVD